MSGLSASLLYLAWKGRIDIWKPTLLAFAMEIVDMGLLLLMARPFDNALNLVKVIAMPLVLADTFGMLVFAFSLRDMRATPIP